MSSEYSPKVYTSQFKKRNFSVVPSNKYCPENLFIESQWFSSRLAFCVYRALICAYSWGWLIYFWATSKLNLLREYFYLTNLGEVLQAIMFSVLLLTAVYGALIRRSLTGKLPDFVVAICWLLQNCSYMISLYICIFFWIFHKELVSEEFLTDPLNIHKHGIVGVLVIIDVFMAATPIRLLHSIYIIPVAFLYVLYTLILHWTGVTSAVYPVIDWQNRTLFASLLAAGSVLIVPFIIHGVVFLMYTLRMLIYLKRQCGRVSSYSPNDANEMATITRNDSNGQVNYAFENEPSI